MTAGSAQSDELHGAAAQEFAREHLIEINVDTENWIIEYVCPETGQKWMMDFPYPVGCQPSRGVYHLHSEWLG